ncbi:MAG TPA: hypothetical protein VFC00_15450 [Micromonosporaceae bacterium]|nr:hypothetical protein [Micromonosporaceae bacterium]
MTWRRGSERRQVAAPLVDALRSSLVGAADAGRAPAGDLGGTAIRRGRRLYRGHTAGAALALAVVTMLAGGGLALWFAYHPNGHGFTIGPPPVRPAPDASSDVDGIAPPEVGPAPDGPLLTVPLSGVRLPADVIVGRELRDTRGARVDLSAIGTISAGYRTDGGWLVVGAAANGLSTLWFATTDRAPRRLLAGDVRDVTVDGRGTRISWRSSTGLSVATVKAGALASPVHTASDDAVTPVGFAGAGVLLSRTDTSGLGADEVAVTVTDVWYPDLGEYRPTAWDPDVLSSYGALPGGRMLVGQVLGPRGERCLALLDTASLRAIRRACGLPLTARTQGWLSPGGRWLVLERTSGTRVVAGLVDLTTVFTTPIAISVGATPQGGAAWVDDNTVVRANAGILYRLRLDRIAAGLSGGTERIVLPGVSANSTLLVVSTG